MADKAKERDYYELLEVSPRASAEVIDRSFKVLMKRYHPDLANPGQKEEYERIAQELNEARAVLLDENRRQSYDRSREQLERDTGASADTGSKSGAANEDLFLLGAIVGTDSSIYSNGTVSAFLVQQSGISTPISLQQLRLIHTTRGIDWTSPRIGAQMEDFLGVAGTPTATPDSSAAAGNRFSFESEDNVYFGDHANILGKSIPLGYQNSTKLFFRHDARRDSIATVSDAQLLRWVKRGNGVRWLNEEMRRQVYGILGLRYRGPARSSVHGKIMDRIYLGFSKQTLAAVLVVILVLLLGLLYLFYGPSIVSLLRLPGTGR
jgi:curved DNA-binding protein CbpA